MLPSNWRTRKSTSCLTTKELVALAADTAFYHRSVIMVAAALVGRDVMMVMHKNFVKELAKLRFAFKCAFLASMSPTRPTP